MKFLTPRNIIHIAILTTIALFVVDFLIYGSGISGDTPAYLSLAGDVYKGEFPFSSSYLPGFPFIVGLTAKITAIKIFQAASLWIGLFYVINLIYIGKTIHYLNRLGKITKTGSYFLFFILISWWSFRIQKATHADAMYFSLLLILTYYLIKAFQNYESKYFLIIGFVLAIMAITKYNSYVLLPILGLIIIMSKIDFKKKIIFLIFSILPPFVVILIWKILNGGFIYAFKVNNYWHSQNTTLDIFKVFYLNISETGKELIETLVNPVFGRYLNLDVGFLVGLSLIMVLFIALYKFRKSQQEMMFLIFATIYLISVIEIQSLNRVVEINIRTLITFNFFIFLVIGSYILKNNLKFLGGILFLLLFSNNVLMEIKWLTETSKKNSFKYEYATNNRSVVTNKSFIKRIENKEVFSNDAESLMFHLNYQKHIKKFSTGRIFSKGKFHEITPDIIKQILENLTLVIENGGVVVFSNTMSTNDSIIFKDLLAKKYYSKNFDQLILLSKSN